MSSSRGPHRDSDDDVLRRGGPRIQDVARRTGVAIGTVSNVLNNPEIVTEQTRLKVGVRRAVAELGASLDVVEAPNLKIGLGRELGREILQSRRIDGVICPSDPLAVGVIQAATDLDIRVADDLLVIGYDDDHFASESSIPVSTVSQPGHRMGELAVELLIEEIRRSFGHNHRTETPDPHVIPRRSTLRSREDTSKWKGTHVAHMVGTAHSP